MAGIEPAPFFLMREAYRPSILHHLMNSIFNDISKFVVNKKQQDYCELLRNKEKFDSSTRLANLPIEKINEQVQIDKMLEFVVKNESDFLYNTSRQQQIWEQQDTTSIDLVKISGLKTRHRNKMWHNDTVEPTIFYSKYSIITEWLEKFAEKHNAELGKTAIVRLQPGGIVYEHEDYGLYYYNRDRYHLVLSGNYIYKVHNQIIHAYPGLLFWFNNKLQHCTFNSTQDRISIVFDLKPKQDELKSFWGREQVEQQFLHDPDLRKNW